MIQQQVFDIVQKTFDYTTEALAQGQKVVLGNFGVLAVKVRKASVGRNPKVPVTDVRIPARAVVKFKAGKKLRDKVLKLMPRKATRTVKTEPVEKVVPPKPQPPAALSPS
jgi:nucleoid DNA-binding protein